MASKTEPDLEDDVTEVAEQNVVAVDSKVARGAGHPGDKKKKKGECSMAGENPNKLVFLNKNC